MKKKNKSDERFLSPTSAIGCAAIAAVAAMTLATLQLDADWPATLRNYVIRR